MNKPRKPKKDKTAKAIESHERAIRRKREQAAQLRAECEGRCAKIEKAIPQLQYLLEGLKSGALKV